MISSFGENHNFITTNNAPTTSCSWTRTDLMECSAYATRRAIGETARRKQALSAQQERNEDVYTRIQDATTFHDPISLISDRRPLEVMSGETVITRGSTQNETQQETQQETKEPAGKQTQGTGNKNTNGYRNYNHFDCGSYFRRHLCSTVPPQ